MHELNDQQLRQPTTWTTNNLNNQQLKWHKQHDIIQHTIIK